MYYRLYVQAPPKGWEQAKVAHVVLNTSQMPSLELALEASEFALSGASVRSRRFPNNLIALAGFFSQHRLRM
jgi:hypothetical protein